MSTWTDNDKVMAVRLWREGVSAGRIAALIGTTRCAITSYLDRQGVTGLSRVEPTRRFSGEPRPGAVKLAAFDPMMRRALADRAAEAVA